MCGRALCIGAAAEPFGPVIRMMPDAYYYRRHREAPIHGPVTVAELRTLAGSGELRLTDQVLFEGAHRWCHASTLRGVFTAPPSEPDRVAEPPAFKRSLLLGRLGGASVHVHWSWFAVVVPAFIVLGWNSSLVLSGLLCAVIFGILLLHEFGHVLACRSVGGRAEHIVLWPLGGLAFVAPPPRPVAVFWTIAAGPLVNLLLIPVLIVFSLLVAPWPLLGAAVKLSFYVNVAILVFNLLPFYPLDGGRLVQALLWPLFGRAVAQRAAAALGFLGAFALLLWSLAEAQWWLVATAAFMLWLAFAGWVQAGDVARMQRAGRRDNVACPNCGEAPPAGRFWRCRRCAAEFDVFDAVPCKAGGQPHVPMVSCPLCVLEFEVDQWRHRDMGCESGVVG